MINTQALKARFQRLLEWVSSETEMAPFIPSARELLEQAEALAAGERRIRILKHQPSLSIPSEDLAKRLMKSIAAEQPMVEDEERLRCAIDGHEHVPGDTELLHAYATIEANLFHRFVNYLFRDYPHLVPREHS